MRGLFQSALALLTLGLGVIGCSRSGPPEESPNPANQKVEAPYQAAFHVPGMSWPRGWPDRVRAALATLPWVEQDKTTFDFKQQTIVIGYKKPEDYNPRAVVEALKTVGNFKGASEIEKK